MNNRPLCSNLFLRCLTVTAVFFVVVSFAGCTQGVKVESSGPEKALVLIEDQYPEFSDDMDLDSLAQALNRNLEYLKRLNPDHIFTYGPTSFTCRQVLSSQEAFLKLISTAPDTKTLNRELRKDFILYRIAGRAKDGKVLFTGYYEPILDASLQEQGPYTHPLYGLPEDLVKVDLSLFNKKYKGESIIARVAGNRVIPYYTRKEIEDEKALQGRGLEIAWLKDPVDVAFLQIQGSGRLRLEGGETIPVGYMAANGHQYNAIGKYLIEKGYIKKEDMSMQAIRTYLSGHPEIVSDVLNYNPSYIFFRVLDNDSPLGNIEVPLTAGRSIAMDSGLFPKGALCFITCEKPVVNSQGEIEGWTRFSRFVMNQDTGGAIKGTARADIFWGNGQYAETAAGHLKHEGTLYMLMKRPGPGESLD